MSVDDIDLKYEPNRDAKGSFKPIPGQLEILRDLKTGFAPMNNAKIAKLHKIRESSVVRLLKK